MEVLSPPVVTFPHQCAETFFEISLWSDYAAPQRGCVGILAIDRDLPTLVRLDEMPGPPAWRCDLSKVP